jgi:hypothetical protein
MPDFARQRAEVPELVPILESWAISTMPDGWKPGASDSEISRAERTVGRGFPAPFRGLYEVSDGISILGGNLKFHSLWPKGDRLGLTNASSELREWEWPIPAELLVFGDNGADEVFGLWLPIGKDASSPRPVIEVGEIFEPKSFAVVGTSMCRFLRAWTAYYTLLVVKQEDRRTRALDALGVPNDLRLGIKDELLFRRLFVWADPDLADPNPDPYKRGLSAQDLRRTFGADQS